MPWQIILVFALLHLHFHWRPVPPSWSNLMDKFAETLRNDGVEFKTYDTHVTSCHVCKGHCRDPGGKGAMHYQDMLVKAAITSKGRDFTAQRLQSTLNSEFDVNPSDDTGILPTEEYLEQANALLQVGFSALITSNWDDLLEKTCLSLRKCYPWSQPSGYDRVFESNGESKTPLLKVEGDYTQPGQWWLTLDDVDHHMKESDLAWWTKLLKLRTVLFLGPGISADPSKGFYIEQALMAAKNSAEYTTSTECAPKAIAYYAMWRSPAIKKMHEEEIMCLCKEYREQYGVELLFFDHFKSFCENLQAVANGKSSEKDEQ